MQPPDTQPLALLLTLKAASCGSPKLCASAESMTWGAPARRTFRYDSLMFVCLRHLLGWVVSVFRCREELLLENIALRQQLLALHSKRPRPRLSSVDRLFWVVLRKFSTGWKRSLILVTPETVVRWHRAGFRLYWRWLSRTRRIGGRKPLTQELRDLIFRMVAENPTWGAPRIHGELLKLGFDISERTVSRWVKRANRDSGPARRWLAFLRNHREAIAAMDFFTVPTLTFGVLYCFFVIGHDRRKLLHCNVTRQPTASWIVLQLREAWGYDKPHRFLIFDRDAKFSADVISTVKQNGTEPVRTALRSPWQNGVAERWVGSVRRELLDHVIVLNQRHLRRLLKEYVRYYHEDRTHLGLGKDTPGGRVAASTVSSASKIASLPRLGGLHHRYMVAA
jgi:putative transposase